MRKTPGLRLSRVSKLVVEAPAFGRGATARFLGLAIVVLSFAGQGFAATGQRPNILLLCIDDLKPLLGCYGEAVVRSPNIDRLATRGVLFESAYCNQAVCAPSRNALMTGLRSTTLGIYDLPTNFRVATPEAVTLAQYFRQHGWRAEALGKIMHSTQGNREDAESWSVPYWRPSEGMYALPNNKETLQRARISGSARGPLVENADVPDTAYADGMIADEAIKRLRAAQEKPETPFFLAVGFLKPHLPFGVPKRYWDLYRRDTFPLPAINGPPVAAPDYAPSNSQELRELYSDFPRHGPVSEEQQRELIHGYHAAVSYMDAQLGRVVDELDRLRLFEKTIIVLWGDHGWHLGDHGQWGKETNYEQATRIPLIVLAPGVSKPGTRTRSLVESVDIYPTLAELAALPPPQSSHPLDGLSFAAILRDPQATTKQAVFHAYPRDRSDGVQLIGRAVRTPQYRLVEWKVPRAAPETADLELYDYVADPLETKNVAAAQPDIVGRLRALLAAQPEARPQVKTAPGVNSVKP